MTTVRVNLVDVYPLRFGPGGIEALVLRRAVGGRCPGSWEAVHGHIESGESPAAAAERELAEETGLVADRLYNLSRVELFYQHGPDEVALVPVFAAIVAKTGTVATGPEHDAAEWLPVETAAGRYSWPREARAVRDAARILADGTAGALEDVLRVPNAGQKSLA